MGEFISGRRTSGPDSDGLKTSPGSVQGTCVHTPPCPTPDIGRPGQGYFGMAAGGRLEPGGSAVRAADGRGIPSLADMFTLQASCIELMKDGLTCPHPGLGSPEGMITSKGPPWDFPGGAVSKNTPGSAGWYSGSLPGLGRSNMPWHNQARVPRLLCLHTWGPHSATGDTTALSRWTKLARSSKHPAQSKNTIVDQLFSRVRLFVTQWTAGCQASLSISNSWSLLKLMPIESEMPSNHLILCHPLLLLPSIFPSIRVFSNELALRIRWPKHWSFSFNISPSNEHPGLSSFRMNCLDLLAVQGTLKSLLQYHSSKSINSSALSFLYNPTLTSIHDYWKNHSLD